MRTFLAVIMLVGLVGCGKAPAVDEAKGYDSTETVCGRYQLYYRDGKNYSMSAITGHEFRSNLTPKPLPAGESVEQPDGTFLLKRYSGYGDDECGFAVI